MAGAPLEKTDTPGVYRRGAKYTVLYRDEQGRQRQKTARTKQEALKLRARLIAAVDAGTHQDGASREKLADYALEWIERHQGVHGTFREASREEYRRQLHTYVLPQLGDQRLPSLTPRQVARWVHWLADEHAQGVRKADERRAKIAAARGVALTEVPRQKVEPVYLADDTIAKIVTVLRTLYSTALAEGLVSHNPTTGIRLPKRDAQRRIDLGIDDDDQPAKALTTEELATLIRCTPERYRLHLRVLAATGLRISELLALRWKDVTLDGSTPHVHVRRAYVKKRFGPPKSRHGRRRVPLGDDLVLDLRRHRAASEWHRDDDLVFSTRNGTPYDDWNLMTAALRPAREEAGVPWAGFHTLRHTCATRLFAAGRNAVQVQRWLGHHSPAFTLSTYVHLLDDDLGEALPEPLGASRGPASTPELHRDPRAA